VRQSSLCSALRGARVLLHFKAAVPRLNYRRAVLIIFLPDYHRSAGTAPFDTARRSNDRAGPQPTIYS